MKSDQLLKVILLCATIGVALSAYSFAHHYEFVSGALCDINATFNCDIVNRGPFSEIGGVPVSLMGIVGYGFLFVAAMIRLHQPHDRSIAGFLVIASGGAFLFALYLTGIEAFVLRAWCIVCLTSQAAIAVAFASSVALFVHQRRLPPV